MPFDPLSLPNQAGRVAIVTGANTGLGFETALVFARKGIKTILACRNKQKAEAAIGRIEEQVSGADLDFIALDLSELASVRRFAEQFSATHDHVDLLVLNAGIMVPPYSKTVDGFESQMAANYFGHFLLTSLLLPKMPDDAASRVVTLSSNAHRMGKKRIDFEDLHWEQKYSALSAYAQSKLACLMFGNELARRLAAQGKKIVAASAHPGASPTELARFINPVIATLLRVTVLPFITHKPAKGALPQIQAALDSDVQGGDYFGPTGFSEMKGPPGKVGQLPYASDEGEGAKLWDLSRELTGAVFPWE